MALCGDLARSKSCTVTIHFWSCAIRGDPLVLNVVDPEDCLSQSINVRSQRNGSLLESVAVVYCQFCTDEKSVLFCHTNLCKKISLINIMSAERGDLPPLRGGIFLILPMSPPAIPYGLVPEGPSPRRALGTKGGSLIASPVSYTHLRAHET